MRSRLYSCSDCVTGKVAYTHKKTAQAAVETLHRYHRGKRFRAYRCRLCNRWHLTTQAPRPKAVPVGG